MSPHEETTFLKYCAAAIKQLGPHALRAVDCVLFVTALLLLVALIVGQWIGSGSGSQAHMATWLSAVPWWAYIGSILGIAWVLSLRAQYGAFAEVEKRALRAEAKTTTEAHNHRLLEIIDQALNGESAQEMFGWIFETSNIRIETLEQVCCQFRDWVNETNEKLASIPGEWSKTFGGSTDIKLAPEENLYAMARLRYRRLEQMHAMITGRLSAPV